MLIRKISLYNFRNFKNSEINFSCDPNKNFTIILGQNTFGKTTLIKSFVWCLYRENLFDDPVLLNADVANEMLINSTADVKVELELDHKGCTYKITTKETYQRTAALKAQVIKKAFSSLVKISDDGNAVPMNGTAAEEEIDSILRPELKEYFFFDGETNSIEKISEKKNLSLAVTNILGLAKLEMLKEYYDPNKNDSVPSYLKRQKVLIESSLLDNLNYRLEETNSSIEKKNKEFLENEEEIFRLQSQIKKLEEELDANKDVEKDQNDKKSLETSLSDDKKTKEVNFSRLINIFNSGNSFLKVLFANSYVKYDLQNLLSSSNFRSENSLKYISDKAVDMLIARGYCLCGTKIENNNDAYKHLIEAKEHMEPRDYGKYANDFLSLESSNVFTGQTILDDLCTVSGKLLDLIEKIDDDEKRLDTIKKRIEGRSDVGELQRRIRNIEFQLGQKNSTNRRIKDDEIPILEKRASELNEQIMKNSVKNEQNEFIDHCLLYTDKIYNGISEKLKKSKFEIKAKLTDEVNRIFEKMYTGNRTITIDDNFKVDTKTRVAGFDMNIDKSQGLGTVVNYSFVAGLMKMAKLKWNNDEFEDTDESNDVYPLVMDAPFSNTDENHIRNICKTLPDSCDQIIMFVMNKDFNYAEETIKSKIGKKYRLEKVSETESNILEE